MKVYISGERAAYEDMYHGQFSYKLAKWAIGMMGVKDAATEKMHPVTPRSLDDVLEILKANDVKVPERSIYTAWYLYMMAVADYQKSLPTDKHRALYVDETLGDPDGDSSDVLACFEAKMCNAGVPIYWERMI